MDGKTRLARLAAPAQPLYLPPSCPEADDYLGYQLPVCWAMLPSYTLWRITVAHANSPQPRRASPG